MVLIITHQRNKCIGCNACVELAPEQWKMSKNDGKSVLLKARERKGFYTAYVSEIYYEANEKAARACPVNIIKVKLK